VVYDARYWREQAVLCLEIARQISDRPAADKMRATATEYFARAAELDKRSVAATQQQGAAGD
jgi:hypothetical protein